MNDLAIKNNMPDIFNKIDKEFIALEKMKRCIKIYKKTGKILDGELSRFLTQLRCVKHNTIKLLYFIYNFLIIFRIFFISIVFLFFNNLKVFIFCYFFAHLLYILDIQ
jgi:hypothetical protein